MYEKLSAMYIALVFWFIHECILLPPAATYVAGPAAGWPNHRCKYRELVAKGDQGDSNGITRRTALICMAEDKKFTAIFNRIHQSDQFSATPAPPPTQYPPPLPRAVVSEEDMDALLLEFSQLH
jgi:hypothetical protein